MAITAVETWKQVPGYEGLYDVSDYGRVRRWYGHGECMILRCPHDTYGYRVACLYKDRNRKPFKIHRLVAMAFVTNTKNKKTVNHDDGVKDNNCLENLWWATQGENNKHAYDTGLHGKLLGSDGPNSRYADNEVYDIKILISKGYASGFIRKIFYMPKSTFNSIKSGKTWGHLQLKKSNIN